MILKQSRVLQIGKFYPPHFGGMETHLRSLCEGLRDELQVEVLVANTGRKTVVENINGLQVTRCGALTTLAAASICPSLSGKIRDTKADLIHLHWPNPTAVMSYLNAKPNGRLICTYHSDIVRQKVLRPLFQPILSHLLRRADAIIVGSPNYLNSAQPLKAVRDKCHIIPFGISVKEFEKRDEGQISEIRRRYGQRIVLGVGRLVYYKGFDYLIRAMKNVRAHLLLIGSGPMLHSLKRLARRHRVEGRVSFLTDVADARPYYHACDVFALSSIARSEAFGLAQLEAMACGKPIVNTALDSGVPFVSPHGVTGLTVPPADETALSNALNSLLDNFEQRKQLGLVASKRVRDEFSVKAMTDRTLELYRDVLRH